MSYSPIHHSYLSRLQSQYPLTVDQLEQLALYVELLKKWNQTYNLTGFKTVEAFYQEFIFESVSLLPHIEASHKTFIDLGTGAGVPGIILAICKPDCDFMLIDSNGKKVRFLHHVIRQLKLNNVQALQTRIEAFKCQTHIDGLLTKAFASLEKTAELTKHLNITTHYALKGPSGHEEVTNLNKSFKIINLPHTHKQGSVLLKISN